MDTLDTLVIAAALVAALALAWWFARQADDARASEAAMLAQHGDLGDAHREALRRLASVSHVRAVVAVHQEGAWWPWCKCGKMRREHVNGRHRGRVPGGCVASNCQRYEAA